MTIKQEIEKILKEQKITDRNLIKAIEETHKQYRTARLNLWKHLADALSKYNLISKNNIQDAANFLRKFKRGEIKVDEGKSNIVNKIMVIAKERFTKLDQSEFEYCKALIDHYLKTKKELLDKRLSKKEEEFRAKDILLFNDAEFQRLLREEWL